MEDKQKMFSQLIGRFKSRFLETLIHTYFKTIGTSKNG